MALTVLLILFIFFLIAGMPVALCFLAASLAYFWMVDTPFELAARLLSSGVQGVTLLAVPLYILAGELMNATGVTQRIFNFANSLVGHLRGGLGHVNILASLIFSGMSGSSSADAAGLGRIEIQAMREQGYRLEFAASITAVSSTIGPIVPPSIHLVLFGAIAEVGIDHLFLAGIVPGLIMTICLMVAVWLQIVTGRENCPRSPRPKLCELATSFKNAILPLFAPVLIVGGILSGVFTPTEAGAVAVIYALILGFVYGEISLVELKSAGLRAVRSTVVVMFILATAKVFAWGITVEKVPELLSGALLTVSQEPTVMILMVLFGLLLLGMFESASANLVIVTPILVPLAPQLGMDIVHMGIVIVLALMIGIITPPVGISLFIVADIVKLPFERIAYEVIPYVLALIAALLVVTFLPDLILYIPRLYGYIG
jgi:tripartite ATP-independent transporter DctM subunit